VTVDDGSTEDPVCTVGGTISASGSEEDPVSVS
jgi:hypothetical protein